MRCKLDIVGKIYDHEACIDEIFASPNPAVWVKTPKLYYSHCQIGGPVYIVNWYREACV